MSKLTKDNVEFLVVHAAATPPSLDIGVREIRRWHRARGFMDVGYHFVIKRDGTIEKGRPITQPGAHVLHWNDVSIGLCLVGGVDENNKPEANYTDAQYESLRWTLDTLVEMFPKAKVQGHRDFPDVAKECPCYDAAAWYYGAD